MSTPNYLSTPFLLLTPRLVIVPTPIAIQSNDYVQLYADLHASEAFCQMAFGPHLLARSLSVEETRTVIQTRDLERCWRVRGMGDFAVGLRASGDNNNADIFPSDTGRKLSEASNVNILESFNPEFLKKIHWLAYAGVRDATTTSLPDQLDTDPPLPDWQDMIELRYGVHERAWGTGVAREAAMAVMQWAVCERGARRFIAETERGNQRSQGVLRKLGFTESGTGYWKEESEIEWVRGVEGLV